MPVLLSLVVAAAYQFPAQQAQPRLLTLEAAVAAALQQNAAVQRGQLEVASSEAGRLKARAAIMPRIDLNASASRVHSAAGEVTGGFIDPVSTETVLLRSPTQTYSSYMLGLSMTQLLFDGGRWWNRIAASDLGAAAAREGLDEARLDTVYAAEFRFYELLRAQRQLQVLTDAAARSREQAEATRELFRAGRQTQADVFAARANSDNDEIKRLEQAARVELARHDLAVVVGVDPGEEIAVEEPPGLLAEPSAPPPADLAVHKALTTRPYLRSLEHQVAARQRLTDVAKGGYWPMLALSAQYNRQTWDTAAFTSGPDRAGTISGGVNLTWNLFDGLGTTAEVREAQVKTRQADNDLREERRVVAAQVRDAVARLEAARQLAIVAARNEETSRAGLGLARIRQKSGAGTQLEVRDAELKLTLSQLARVGALVGGREAEAALRRAMGGEPGESG